MICQKIYLTYAIQTLIFLPKTMSNTYKIIGWLATDFMHAIKLWLWMHCNADATIEEHFNDNNNDEKNAILSCAQLI